MSPQVLWAQDSSVDLYLNKIQEQKVWRHPQWIKLGHYREGLSGYSSPLKGDFFLDKEGRSNPRAELETTIRTLFGTSQGKALQCRYLARTRWLKQILDFPQSALQACPERDQWKAKLSAKEVYLVFASSDLSSAASSFGHTFLRLHNPQNKNEKTLLDYGINYAASTGDDSGAIYALKGIFGYYPGVFSMLPYHQKLREYSNVEGRDIWEYKLDLDPEEIALLVDHLLELEGSYADYYFSNDNCSQQILELLEVARPQLKVADQFKDFTIPLDTVKILAQRGLLVSEQMRPSLRGQWQASYAGLNSNQKNAVVALARNQNENSFKDLSAQEKAEVLEATMSYLALEEYKNGQEFRDRKYKIAVERAQLGVKTEPVQVETQGSPLFGHDTSAWYLGGGQVQDRSFYRLKYRRGFHDLLSDDRGLTPFSNFEFLGLDFRYFTEDRQLDLAQLTVLKILTTYPVNAFERPLSWSVDLGTAPKLSPYLNFGVGYGVDVAKAGRALVMLISENSSLSEAAKNSGGLEARFLTRSDLWRSEWGAKYLYSFQDKEAAWSPLIGISYGGGPLELRLESEWRKGQPEWMFSLIF